MSHRGIFNKTHLLSQRMQPSLLFSVSFLSLCFFLHLLVALRLRSLWFHCPRLSRVAVFLIPPNVSLFPPCLRRTAVFSVKPILFSVDYESNRQQHPRGTITVFRCSLHTPACIATLMMCRVWSAAMAKRKSALSNARNLRHFCRLARRMAQCLLPN